MSKKRNLNRCVQILTYLWLKWIVNYEKSNDSSLDMKQRRSCAERCEKMQRIRYKVISEIDRGIEYDIKFMEK